MIDAPTRIRDVVPFDDGPSSSPELTNAMRRALVVGIDYYGANAALHGCVDDAHAVRAVLAHHGDGTPNFDVKVCTAASAADRITRAELKDAIADLFDSDDDVALFYFAGHGHIESTGGYLLASDSRRGDEGVALAEILVMANRSRARNRIIVLDSCHSGIAGTPPSPAQVAELTEGLTILTASTKDQYAMEDSDGGVFTRLFVDALQGAAANLVGKITPGSVYAHIDQSLGSWGQRPVFKSNVKHFVALREVPPAVDVAHLRRLVELFPTRGFHLPLDPSFEPEAVGRTPDMPPPDPAHTQTFAILQRLNRVNLVVPVDAPHMWHAAMQRKACKLTALGEHYRRLAERNRL